MPLKLYPAIPADAGRISEIHMAAFASNAMLLAQFQTPEVREGLRESIRLKAVADIKDPKISVLVVRDISQNSDTSDVRGVEDDRHYPSEMSRISDVGNSGKSEMGKVIAFAKWSHPVGKDENYEEAPWIWPPGTNMNILEGWGRATEEVQAKIMGDKPCYRLTFMGTDPLHERRGAALMMVRWGLEQCRKDDIPGYLESTLDAAPFYQKMGFTTSQQISLRYQLQDRDRYEVYEELAFVYHSNSI
ncbi:putative GNAT family acetyltransferase [Xylaria flabelliformis]|nr:putative GNAT family acetyltransferase [Xylaria flabelliformis]